MELLENADVATSICSITELMLSFFGDHARTFAYLFSLIEVRMLNIVIEYRISNVTAFSCGRGYF